VTQSGTYYQQVDEQVGKNSSEQSADSRGGTATLNRQGARLPKRGTAEQLEPATVAQLLNAYRQQNLGTLLGVLTQRPAEFARQLGRLCRVFPEHVHAIAQAFGAVGRALPIDELVRLHNRYSNAARGVGEHLSLDNSGVAHLVQSPALSREGAGHLLMAVELCLAGRMRGLTIAMPSTEAFTPADQAPSLGSCNPALDGAPNAFGGEANTHVTPVSLGLPGSLPVVNAQAVEDSVRAGLSRVLPRALARPEPPSRTAVSSAHSTWVHRTSQGLPPTWARSLEASVASPETLAGQTAEAVGSVALPGHRQPLIDLLWWGGLLMVLGGVSWLTASVVREGLEVLHRSIEIAPVCLVAVGLLALLIATVRRRSRARREAQRYGQRVRDRLESVVERGLSRPAGKILDKHRVLQSALGL